RKKEDYNVDATRMLMDFQRGSYLRGLDREETLSGPTEMLFMQPDLQLQYKNESMDQWSFRRRSFADDKEAAEK
ncbi:MAG: hypothetical protein AAFN70_06615, partial [Planctomycetota bacterium]